MLGDNIVGRSLRPAVERFVKQEHGARVLLAEIKEPDHLRHLGVAAFDDHHRILAIIEKPDSPPSTLAVTRIYFYETGVFDVLPTLQPSGRGELEITDVNLASRRVPWNTRCWRASGATPANRIDAYYAVDDHVRRHGANAP